MDEQNQEIKEGQSTTDFMPNVTYGAGDNLIYFKFFDFITGGRAFRVKDILAVIVEIVITFVVLLIFLGTTSIFAQIKYAILPSLIFVIFMLMIMVLTLIPKYDKNALNYIMKYGRSLTPKVKKNDTDKPVYDEFMKIETNGDIIYFLVANGRMSELLFEDEKEVERRRIMIERNELDGITATNSKGFADQTFKAQKKMIKKVIEETDDPDLEFFAKKSMLVYHKQLKQEKVEKQFLTFKTHNDDERRRLSTALDNWRRENVLMIDEQASKERIREIFEEF